jgi:hypothetical protein
MKPKVVFMPGSFDDFDGTQEELDEFIKMIEAKAEDGTLFEDSRSIDPDSEEGLELIARLNDKDIDNRNLQ